MGEVADPLLEVQRELALAKKALSEDEDFLGMRDEVLKQYILQLNEKELFYLSKKQEEIAAVAAQLASAFAETAASSSNGIPGRAAEEELPELLGIIAGKAMTGDVPDPVNKDGLEGIWSYAEGAYAYKLTGVDSNPPAYQFEEVHSDGIKVEAMLKKLDDKWYLGKVWQGGECCGQVRLRLESGSVISNFRRAEDSAWGDDIVAVQQQSPDTESPDTAPDHDTGMATATHVSELPADSKLTSAAPERLDQETSDVAPDYQVAATAAYAGILPAAKELPPGAPEPFDRNNLDSIGAHLSKYEASAGESGKALRALSACAYTNPMETGGQPDIVSQVLRVLALHPMEDHVQLYGMKSLGNMAYDTSVALGSLSSTDVLGAMLAVIRNHNSKEIKYRASEAVGRLVAAEVGSQESTASSPESSSSPVRALFTIACVDAADELSREVVITLVERLLSNEIATIGFLAMKFVEAGKACEKSGFKAEAWLRFAEMLAERNIRQEGFLLSDALTVKGAIAAAQGLMSMHVDYGGTQFAGMGALSSLIGDSTAALEAFAEVRGVECIEVAMNGHPTQFLLQSRGIRALAGGCCWTKDIREKAGFSLSRSIEFTKIAMVNHPEEVELQMAALDAFVKYYCCPTLDKQDVRQALQKDGGVEIVENSCQLLADQPDSIVSDEVKAENKRFMKFIISAC